MVTLAWYLREVPPNKGGRSIKDHKNYPLGVAVETQFWYSSFNPSFNQTIKQSTSFQATYIRATLICIDLSLSIFSTKLLTCNHNGKINVLGRYDKALSVTCRSTRQCLRALTLTLKCLIPSFSYIHVWPLVNTGKNDKKGKPWTAKGWLRSLNKGGHLLKITITVFVLYAGKIGASKTARLIQLKGTTRQNVQERHMKKQTNKQTNKQLDKRKERHMKKETGTWQTLFVCFFFFCRVTPACALTFVVYQNVIHFLMPPS